ncbi:MAG: monovalent cation/H+ antiporter subunit D family protein [Alphaproteobacteria bacterium]|nr:monovalent cation/H+ antiporter subunit D family protein [Alphaproteobacteria bacterium]
MAAHLPILQVVIPLVAAPVSVFCRRASVAWYLTFLVSIAAFAVSVALLDQVLDKGTLSYAIGGWAPPWGIEYRVDAANAIVLLIISGTSTVVLPYARTSVAHEVEPHNQVLFYTCYLLCFTGLLGIVVTGDAFNVFVFLEISSLATYVLVAMGASRDRRALTAAYTYLVMGTIGATFFVIGVGLMYMMTGTLNMADLAQRIPAIGPNRTLVVAFAFIVTGLGLKLALFPLHLWLPNAYTFAPSAVTVFLAATATKAAIYLLLRFLFTIFGTGFTTLAPTLAYLLLPLAILAMFAASTVAIFQVDIKRMLAYSSVAQLGYMVLGLSFASFTGLTAAMLHVFNHALMKGALFMALGAVVFRFGSAGIDDMRGLGRLMPWTMAAFTIGGLSLIGVPLTVGFISKWYLVSAALESGMWPIAALVVASSLLAVIYIWRVVEAAYLEAPPEGATAGEAPLSMLIPTWLLVGANLYFGIDASLTTGVAGAAARVLLGGGAGS